MGSLPPREAWIEINNRGGVCINRIMSLPPREAWIEIFKQGLIDYRALGCFPCGKRGLKLLLGQQLQQLPPSLPSREAWIEIRPGLSLPVVLCRFPCGRRGLKYRLARNDSISMGRFPHGRRGLKLQLDSRVLCGAGRLPRGKRGAEPLAASASFLLHAKAPLPLDKRGLVSLY